MAVQAREMDMTTGPLFKKMVVFALPIMAMNVLQLLFNAADMIVVGQFSGSEALGAIGATGSLINLILNLFMGLSVGTSVVLAQDYGARKPEAVSKTVHTSITLSLVGGIFVMIIGLFACEPLLKMMGTPDDIIDLSAVYMRIYFLGVPASMIYNFGAAILRSSGDSRSPMVFLIISGSVNVVLNLFFVIVLKMSVAGVAWATVISQYLSVFLILHNLSNNPGVIRFNRHALGIDRNKLIDIVKIGLPAGVQGLLFSISNVLIQSAVNSFGSVMVAASSTAGNIEGFAGTTMNAYYNAVVTFTAQNMGAKKYDRIDQVAKISSILVFATWIILGGAIVYLGENLLGFYTSDLEVIELGMVRLKIMMAAYFTCGLMNVYPGLTRGMGYSVLPMLCTLVGACLGRIVWLATVFTWYPTVSVLFIAYPVTWGLAAIGQIVSFFYARKQVRKSVVLETDTVTLGV